MEENTKDDPVSLGIYVHFPFCLKKCRYCDFFSVPFDDENLAARYVSALCGEARIKGTGEAADTVYLGGGTPSLMSPEGVEKLLGALRAAWRIDPRAEISMEANPETVSREKLEAFRRAGVGRLSIGVQSFDDSSLRILGRVHSSARARRAVSEALEAGFEVGVDLMFGLPGQGREEFKGDLSETLGFPISHLSAYELTLERGTPLAEDNPRLPSEETILAQWAEAEEAATRAGMAHYEISNYAVPGKECRHNLKYWKDEDFVGLGAGAHSSLGGERTANPRDIAGYIGSEAAGFPPAAADRPLGLKKKAETLMLNLRLAEGLKIPDFEKRYGKGALEPFVAVLSSHAEAGLLEMGEANIRLTKKGMLLANEVWGDLLSN